MITKTLREWQQDLADDLRIAQQSRDDPDRGYPWAFGYLEHAVARFTGQCFCGRCSTCKANWERTQDMIDASKKPLVNQ